MGRLGKRKSLDWVWELLRPFLLLSVGLGVAWGGLIC